MAATARSLRKLTRYLVVLSILAGVGGLLTAIKPVSASAAPTAGAAATSGINWSWEGSSDSCLNSITQDSTFEFTFTWDFDTSSPACGWSPPQAGEVVAVQYNTGTSLITETVQSAAESFTVDFGQAGGYPVSIDEYPDGNQPGGDSGTLGELVITSSAVTATVTGSQTYGTASAAFTETNNAPAGVTLSGSVTCTAVTGGQAISASLPAGTYTIDAASCSGLSAPAGYTLAYSGGTFTVAQASQVISFSAPDSASAPGSATLTATGGGSGNPVTFSVDPSSGDGVCSVTGDIVTYLATGSCVIDANQAGNTDYQAAGQVTQTIDVNGNHKPVFTQDTPPLIAIAGLRCPELSGQSIH